MDEESRMAENDSLEKDTLIGLIEASGYDSTASANLLRTAQGMAAHRSISVTQAVKDLIAFF